MGNPKQKWTAEEEEALRAGVKKHGTGKWKLIQRDPEFSELLQSRTNIDLKDKWRNLTVSATNGVIPRDKGKVQHKVKTNMDAPAVPVTIPQAPASSTPVSNDVSMDPVTEQQRQQQQQQPVAEDSTKCLLDVKTASKYDAMIYEALSTLNEPNGSDTTTLVNFIEQRHEVPQNFRRLVTTRLRRLVAREKLEKIQNSYRIKKDILQGVKPPILKPNEAQIQLQLKPEPQPQPQSQSQPQTWPQHQPQHQHHHHHQQQQQQHQHQHQHQQHPQVQPQPLQISLGDTIEEASFGAAYTISQAEHKSFVLAEAVKEAERVERMSEDTDVMLQMAHEINNRSLHGEMVLVT